jgi:hypothetical protein
MLFNENIILRVFMFSEGKNEKNNTISYFDFRLLKRCSR